MPSQSDLLDALNSFDAGTRRAALRALLDSAPPAAVESDWMNMHMHTFFSYNGEGWSPARLAWEARQQGLMGIGICDFDVLTGLDEFLWATDLLQQRAAVGFESRTFFEEYADVEINSPGEPGVFYFMGMGFVGQPAPESQSERVLTDMLDQSHTRNRALVERINAALDGLALDYEQDVLPLTPAGNATERHIVRSYFDKALEIADTPDEAARWWAANLGMDCGDLAAKIHDANAFVDMLRAKMMKKGGLGYVQPGRKTFPLLDEVIQMVLECRAIPTSTWLDGTSDGEAEPVSQLECLMAKGVAAVNIIPDRNWNISAPETAARKIQELHRYAEAAAALDLPILVGTELNKPGQRFVDDFNAPALRPLLPAFVQGARVMVGHTRLLRYADLSLVDPEMRDRFPSRADRNRFVAAVGALPAPDAATRDKLTGMTAAAAFSYLHDAGQAATWQ